VLPAGEAGLSISKTAAGLTILRIADNSIARDLKPGDIIIGLDGVDVSAAFVKIFIFFVYFVFGSVYLFDHFIRIQICSTNIHLLLCFLPQN